MRLEYYFRETAAGLRRNGIVAFAAMSTAFIALFLFGLSLLIAREFNLVIEPWTGNVQVAVYLTDPVNARHDRTAPDQAAGAPAAVGGRSSTGTRQRTCQHVRPAVRGQQVFQEGVDCEEAIPTSFRINLADPSQFDQITAAHGMRGRRRPARSSARSPASGTCPTSARCSTGSRRSRACCRSGCSRSR